jgi:small subunit ribosomal protein S9
MEAEVLGPEERMTTELTTKSKTKTGRRKEAVARVLLLPGAGKHLINGREPLDYLERETLVQHAFHALTLTNAAGKFNVEARVHGGGLSGQSGALRMAIARALAAEDETLRGVLGRAGLLTRDPRMKERKKYGQPGARKRFQFSKR